MSGIVLTYAEADAPADGRPDDLPARFDRIAAVAQDRVGAAGPAEVTVILASDAVVRTLNRRFRGQDKPTNVLSFPLVVEDDPWPDPEGTGPLLGEVYLALPTIRREAEARGVRYGDHLAHLLCHGLLHLFGLSHDSDGDAAHMQAEESAILMEAGIPDPYRESHCEVDRRGCNPDLTV